jgi:hypothetical protein
MTTVAVKESSGAITSALTLDGKSVWTTGGPGRPEQRSRRPFAIEYDARRTRKMGVVCLHGDVLWDDIVVEVK